MSLTSRFTFFFHCWNFSGLEIFAKKRRIFHCQNSNFLTKILILKCHYFFLQTVTHNLKAVFKYNSTVIWWTGYKYIQFFPLKFKGTLLFFPLFVFVFLKCHFWHIFMPIYSSLFFSIHNQFLFLFLVKAIHIKFTVKVN